MNLNAFGKATEESIEELEEFLGFYFRKIIKIFK